MQWHQKLLMFQKLLRSGRHDIFQGVYFTGYTQNQAQDGYTVKVVCILSEHAGRQAVDEKLILQ